LSYSGLFRTTDSGPRSWTGRLGRRWTARRVSRNRIAIEVWTVWTVGGASLLQSEKRYRNSERAMQRALGDDRGPVLVGGAESGDGRGTGRGQHRALPSGLSAGSAPRWRLSRVLCSVTVMGASRPNRPNFNSHAGLRKRDRPRARSSKPSNKLCSGGARDPQHRTDPYAHPAGDATNARAVLARVADRFGFVRVGVLKASAAELYPCSRARLSPANTRSRIMARSNSAKTPII
jgi:hypothetical protein